MSVDTASYHGGDGDGRDPTDPSHIPSSCGSGEYLRSYFKVSYFNFINIFFLCVKNISQPAIKKTRGVAANVSLDKRRRDAGKPLELKLDPSTDKVIGDEDQAFVRQLGTEVMLLLPGHYLDFKDVPQQYKDQVVQKMKVT